MVLRILFKFLANNEQLVNKLADSRPMRKAAQFIVHIFYRTGMHQVSDNPMEFLRQLTAFSRRFKIKLKEEIEQAKDDLKRKQQK